VHITHLLLVELYCSRNKRVLTLFRLSRSCPRIMQRRLIPSYCSFERGQRHTKNLQSSGTLLCPFDSRMNTSTLSGPVGYYPHNLKVETIIRFLWQQQHPLLTRRSHICLTTMSTIVPYKHGCLPHCLSRSWTPSMDQSSPSS
jgi:hypothetical protein